MGSNVSIYLSDDMLALLDAEVNRRASADRLRGLSGRRVASRSSVLQQLIADGLERRAPLDEGTIRYEVVSLAKEYGAAKVSLFGSYARGEATGDSDIDLLLEKGAIRGMQVLDFQEELSRRLGRSVDVVTTAGASERFLEKIRSDEVVLYVAG